MRRAYLPARSREEMFGGGRGVAAGVWAPRGTARSVDGGVAITSALLVAYLPARSREEMFGGGRGVAAGVWAPRGTARSVDATAGTAGTAAY